LPSDCVLFYSWSEVKTYDRFADGSEDEEAAERLRTQAREMFQFAQAEGCRHSTLVGYFGEERGACETSCDHCTGRDPVREAAAGRKERGLGRSARSVPPRERDLGAVGIETALFERLKTLRRDLAAER